MNDTRSTRYTKDQAAWAVLFAYNGRVIESEREEKIILKALERVGKQAQVERGKLFNAPQKAAQRTIA